MIEGAQTSAPLPLLLSLYAAIIGRRRCRLSPRDNKRDALGQVWAGWEEKGQAGRRAGPESATRPKHFLLRLTTENANAILQVRCELFDFDSKSDEDEDRRGPTRTDALFDGTCSLTPLLTHPVRRLDSVRI